MAVEIVGLCTSKHETKMLAANGKMIKMVVLEYASSSVFA